MRKLQRNTLTRREEIYLEQSIVQVMGAVNDCKIYNRLLALNYVITSLTDMRDNTKSFKDLKRMP